MPPLMEGIVMDPSALATLRSLDGKPLSIELLPTGQNDYSRYYRAWAPSVGKKPAVLLKQYFDVGETCAGDIER